jgi:Zn-dependent protease
MLIQAIHIAIYIVILIISVMLPEMMHGYVADELGDTTARKAGFLSWNPIRHIDIVGSLVFPLILLFTQAGFIIGWAKPTPYNVHNFKNRKKSVAFVALAGIMTNVVLALVGTVAIRIALFNGYHNTWYIFIVTTFALINMLLALFNCLPIPPLDGFKIFVSFFSGSTERLESIVEYYSVPILIIVIILVWPHIFPFMNSLFVYLTGLPLSIN